MFNVYFKLRECLPFIQLFSSLASIQGEIQADATVAAHGIQVSSHNDDENFNNLDRHLIESNTSKSGSETRYV